MKKIFLFIFIIFMNLNLLGNDRTIHACNTQGKIYLKNYYVAKKKLKNNNIICNGVRGNQTTIHGKSIHFYAASNSCVSTRSNIHCRKVYNETKVSICNFIYDNPEIIKDSLSSSITFGIAYDHLSADIERTIYYEEQISKIVNLIDLEKLPYANFYPYNETNENTSPVNLIELGSDYNPCFLKEYLKLNNRLRK